MKKPNLWRVLLKKTKRKNRLRLNQLTMSSLTVSEDSVLFQFISYISWNNFLTKMLQKMMKMHPLHGSDFTKIPHSKSFQLVTASYQFSLFFPVSYFQSVGSKGERLTLSQELHTEDT